MVGTTRFELATSATPLRRATKLRYVPLPSARHAKLQFPLGKQEMLCNSANMQFIPTAVVGASGYTGMELIRLLLMHPNAQLTCVTSRQHAGKTLADIYPRFATANGSGLTFTEPDADTIAASGAKIAFLALPHGVAADYAAALLDRGIKVIDLSADFRINDLATYQSFYGDHPKPKLLEKAIYGMPELHREAIAQSELIASPGCYPTSIILPLVPLLRAKLIDPQSIITCSMSGVSGAGKSTNPAFLYCEANESVRAYSVPRHRHLSEIEQELSLAAAEKVTISFTPHLVPQHNGICSTSSATLAEGIDPETIGTTLAEAYASEAFIRLLGRDTPADTKNVTRTNFLDIGWSYDPRTNRAILLSAEDNLGKGAAAQAIQSYNILNQLPETTGLLNF